MQRFILPATIILLLGGAAPGARADADVRLWLGAPGYYYYVPGFGAVLRFQAHPRRHHGYRHFDRRPSTKRYYGHAPARPYYLPPRNPPKYGYRDHRRYHDDRYDRFEQRRYHGRWHRFHDGRYDDYRGRGHGHRRYESRGRIYVR